VTPSSTSETLREVDALVEAAGAKADADAMRRVAMRRVAMISCILTVFGICDCFVVDLHWQKKIKFTILLVRCFCRKLERYFKL
jgi:hypothetical protein